ncbi:MAG: NUDIX hydrolase [Candidatus Acidiferrales bacterium]
MKKTSKKQPAAGKSEKMLSQKTLYHGKVFDVRRDHLIEPAGLEVTRDLVVHPGSVVVLPIFDDGRILLIRQYRHSAAQYLWELVAGRIDHGEKPRAAARRELSEETGYTARRFRKLLHLYPTPGFVQESLHIFAAEGLRAGQAHPEEDEKIEPRILSLGEAEKWIRNGTIFDGKSVAAILYYSKFRRTLK